MTDCFQIKKAQELIDLLLTLENRDAFVDIDYQLQTNYGFIYTLKNGQVIFIPNNFRYDGLLFSDKNCLDNFVIQDKFPIENPGKNLHDIEFDRIKEINKQIDYYRNHLNKVLKFGFTEISRDAAAAYLKKVIGRTIKKLTTDTDIVALIAVFGEIIRLEIDGKWVIEKWYGTYNPHFKPRILTNEHKLIFIDDVVLGKIKWKLSSADMIFNENDGFGELQERRKVHECIILEG